MRTLALATVAACSMLVACSTLFGVDFDERERQAAERGSPETDHTSTDSSATPDAPASSGASGTPTATEDASRGGDASPSGDASSGGASSGTTGGLCPAPVPATFSVKDELPLQLEGCTPAQIAIVVDGMNADLSLATMRAQVAASGAGAATCTACLFTPASAAKWGALITNAPYGMNEPGGTKFMFNYGWCATHRGVPASCARAFQQGFTCLSERCTDCTEGAPEEACMNAARVDPATCKPYFDVLAGATCATHVQALGLCTDTDKLLKLVCER
jgi:hypothetical protein